MKTIASTLLLAFCLVMAAHAADIRGPVYFSVDIEPGKWQALELKNLPEDIEVSVAITSEGSITAVFVNSTDLKRFPAVQEPLFIGAVRQKLEFSVTTPAADFYYVVMHNNSDSTTREVNLVVSAKRKDDSGTPAPESAEGALL